MLCLIPRTVPSRYHDAETQDQFPRNVCPYNHQRRHLPWRSILYASQAAQDPMEKAKLAPQVLNVSRVQSRSLNADPRP